MSATSFDDQDWEVVTNVRKEKRIAKREAKKNAQETEQQAAETRQKDVRLIDLDEHGVVKTETVFTQENSLKKSKKGKKKSAAVQISSEDDAIKVLTSVLDVPQGFLVLSAVAERFQAATKIQWNKKLKTRFGSLKDFLVKHNFTVTPENKVTAPVRIQSVKASQSKSKGAVAVSGVNTKLAASSNSGKSSSSTSSSSQSKSASKQAQSNRGVRQAAAPKKGNACMSSFMLVVAVLAAAVVAKVALDDSLRSVVEERVQALLSSLQGSS